MADAISLVAIQAALIDLQKDAGPKADASLTISPDRFHTFFRPNGWGSNEPFIIGDGPTLEASIIAAQEKWAEMRARVQNETTKKMALAIIRIVHEMGCCTDAALRTEFGPGDVERYSAEALSLANTMAENGPFEIMELQGANAA